MAKIKSDPNFFFRYAKKIGICKSDIGPIKNPHTQLLVNERIEICSLLLDQFNSVFTSPITNMIVHDPVSFFSCKSLNPDECLTDIEITEQIIIDSIQELSSTSAAGPDRVPSSLLLKCAAELAPALKVMFSQSLTHGFIPPSLKRAAITPVFKSGTKTSPSNYRPISLTSTIIKVFERIIRKQVVAFMNRQGHLNNTQHGFRSDRSCLSALLDVFDDHMHMLSSDTTDLGITGKLGIWFFQFLTNRTHYVRIPGGISKYSPVLSGVPQGTVLGPLLFLIMISDINKGTTSSKLVSFADDTRVYSNIAEADDCDNLQYDLNSIYNWAVHNNMFFNSEKFHYISFSPYLSFNSYNVYANPNMEIINPSENVLDLGIFMSSNCSFEFHIQNLCKKCSNLSGWILRTFTTRDSITMLTLFKSLVLPRLDYGSQLWSPHLVKHIDQFDKIQRSFNKHITGMQSLEYSERLVSLKLYSLQMRRERYCIIYVWKIIEGLVPNFSKPIVCSYSERRGRSCIISHVNLGRLGSLAYNSFRWREKRLFNAMPKYIRCISSCSVVSFKSKLDCYLKNIVDLLVGLDSATAWTLETFYNGGHRVRTWLPIRCCQTTTSKVIIG